VSVINGVRVRGFGTRNLTWKVNHALTGLAGLKQYFNAVCRPSLVGTGVYSNP
jgi:hypothetical protein